MKGISKPVAGNARFCIINKTIDTQHPCYSAILCACYLWAELVAGGPITAPCGVY